MPFLKIYTIKYLFIIVAILILILSFNFKIPYAEATQTLKKTLPDNLVVHGPPQPTTREFNGPENLFQTPEISGNGNLTFDVDFEPGAATKTMVLFVNGDLTINHDIQHLNGSGNEDPNSGVVFIVKGNVNIKDTVTKINASIISSGIICTAFNGTSCPSGYVTTISGTSNPIQQLVIKGSLISINQSDTEPIKFRRSLSSNNNSIPAEKIVYQPKYLVILRNLVSDTFQKWSEIQ